MLRSTETHDLGVVQELQSSGVRGREDLGHGAANERRVEKTKASRQSDTIHQQTILPHTNDRDTKALQISRNSLELGLDFLEVLSDTDRIGEDGLLIVVLVSLGDGVQLVYNRSSRRQGHVLVSLIDGGMHHPTRNKGQHSQRLRTSSMTFLSSSVGCLSANPNWGPRPPFPG